MRTLMALFLALATAGFLNNGTAWAWDSRLEGAPAALDTPDTAPLGLYLWVDPRTERIRVRTMGDQIYFLTFKLRYGEISDIKTVGLDANDRLERDETKSLLMVKLAGSDTPEGFDFAAGGNRVEITCKIDGGDVCPYADFHLGANLENPDGIPFTINRKE